MKALEFRQIYKMATEHNYPNTEAFGNNALETLSGCAYDKKICTKAQAAYVLNYQALMFNGEYDYEMLEETQGYFKKNITLLD